MINLIYNLTASKPEDADVVSRKLEIYVNGVRVSSKLYDANTESFDPLIVSHNDEVKGYLYDIDHVDNISEPAVVEFVAKDTVAPKKPKDLQYSLSNQTTSYLNALKKN
jgi:hypothetical protein